ncbi:MAG: hypothetical protein ACR2K1_11885 [Saprospiraceae bacterium]
MEAHQHNAAPPAQGATLTDAAAKARHQMLFQRGLRWLAAGVLLMALSFGVNFCLEDAAQLVVKVMYVSTSLGALCMMKGLLDILGF